MIDHYTTRRCHACDRQSWLVAEGKACPWCGKRTGRYTNLISHVIVLASVLALCGLAYMGAR